MYLLAVKFSPIGKFSFPFASFSPWGIFDQVRGDTDSLLFTIHLVCCLEPRIYSILSNVYCYIIWLSQWTRFYFNL